MSRTGTPKRSPAAGPELLQADPLGRAHGERVLVIDETGDRKDGIQTAHVAHQYLGSIGKIANGIALGEQPVG